MITVAVLTEDPAGPSARHRWAYPGRRLGGMGIEIALHSVEPRSERPAAFAAAAAADLAVLHRKMFRWPDLFRLVRALRRRGRRLLYDLDDAVMFRPSGRRRQWSFFRRLRFAGTVRQASAFLAGNEYLKSQAPSRVPAAVLPTPVETARYAPRDEWPERGRVVGWIGTAATAPYLRLVAEPLRELCGRREDLVLRVIGPEPPALPGVTVEHVPWSEETEAESLRTLDVGILPLPDDPWTRGKCAFKALQYMAAGLPVVASPVGVNAEVVADGETGRLAVGQGDWIAALDAILDNAETRRRYGAAGRARVEERYATEVMAPRLAEILLGNAR